MYKPPKSRVYFPGLFIGVGGLRKKKPVGLNPDCREKAKDNALHI
jgi:hypothetical protein